ncbi:hypothetical protein EG328_006201 [Venturia inaequalis]|uniref:Uncharacterized protein n=1 Tax=Venturia inaequalis TaxID=5025 RepID=A0A8H3YRE7_VENIN|nr:hypothetical protein EG328_006201 [Venturia inaequalis]
MASHPAPPQTPPRHHDTSLLSTLHRYWTSFSHWSSTTLPYLIYLHLFTYLSGLFLLALGLLSPWHYKENTHGPQTTIILNYTPNFHKSTKKISPPTTTTMNATSTTCHCPTTNPVLAFDTHVTRFFLLLIHYVFIGAVSVAAMEFWSSMVRANLARSPERRAFLFRGMGC